MNKENNKNILRTICHFCTCVARQVLKESPFRRRALQRTYAVSDSSGRSMVEMLGVLAIIAVLSASALAGYSKAMFKHKMTQTIEIFNQVLQKFSELEQKGFGEGVVIGADGNGTPLDAVNYGLLSDCTEINDPYEVPGCKLPIGILVMDFCDRCYKYISGVVGWFRINFDNAKYCIAFSSAGWDKVIPIEWLNPSGFMEIEDPAQYNSEKNGMNLENIIQACQHRCQNKETCYFYLAVHSDY